MLAARSAHRSISPTIFSGARTWRRSLRHRRLEGEDLVAALLELDDARVDLVVAVDEVVGTLEVAVEQHRRATGDDLHDRAASSTISSRTWSSSWW